jgi:hypothetical protein
MDDFDLAQWDNMMSVAVENMETGDADEPKHYHCGEIHKRINPLTGQFVVETWFCKKYHTCAICRARKQKALLDRIAPLINDPQIRVILHNRPIAELNQQYKGRLHIPLDDGGYYSLVQSSDNSIGQPLTKELAQTLASHGVVPAGKRISGNLGKKPLPGDGGLMDDQMIVEKKEEITRRVFKYVDKDGNVEDKELVNKIESETIAETAELDPQDVDQLQDAIYVREQKLIEVSRRYGVEILFLYKETKQVLISQLKWGINRNALAESSISTGNV